MAHQQPVLFVANAHKTFLRFLGFEVLMRMISSLQFEQVIKRYLLFCGTTILFLPAY